MKDETVTMIPDKNIIWWTKQKLKVLNQHSQRDSEVYCIHKEDGHDDNKIRNQN